MKPDKEITNGIRQVLMNEMGLSREVVRIEMENIIHDTLDKHLSKLFNDGSLQRMARGIVEKYFEPKTFNGENKLTGTLMKTLQAEMTKFVRENVHITTTDEKPKNNVHDKPQS